MDGTLKVEISTPQGIIFAGECDGVEMKTTDGIIDIRPERNSHLSFTRTSEITLRIGSESVRYALENASAGLNRSCLTVIAQTARPLMLLDGAETSDPS